MRMDFFYKHVDNFPRILCCATYWHTFFAAKFGRWARFSYLCGQFIVQPIKKATMERKALYAVGYRTAGGAETETRCLDFCEAIEKFVAFKETGLVDVWIYYDPFPGCL